MSGDSITSLFDTLGTSPTVVANEAISAAAVNYALEKTGISAMYFSGASLDGELMGALRSGLYTTLVSTLGRMARNQFPMLAVFGDGKGAAGAAAASTL